MTLQLAGIRTIAFALLAGLAAGCATPEGPRGRVAATDPACPAAEASPAAALGTALIEDPPLPGMTAPGWPARSDEAAPAREDGADPHAEDHHGHAH